MEPYNDLNLQELENHVRDRAEAFAPFEPDEGGCDLSDPECAYLFIYQKLGEGKSL